MIPMLPGLGGVPVGPERPDLRVTPPPSASVWDELVEVQRKLRDLEERFEKLEVRLAAIEKPRE